jgi:hypothetical protein
MLITLKENGGAYIVVRSSGPRVTMSSKVDGQEVILYMSPGEALEISHAFIKAARGAYDTSHIPSVLTFKAPQNAISTERALKLALKLLEQADLPEDLTQLRQVSIDDLTLMLSAIR